MAIICPINELSCNSRFPTSLSCLFTPSILTQLPYLFFYGFISTVALNEQLLYINGILTQKQTKTLDGGDGAEVRDIELNHQLGR